MCIYLSKKVPGLKIDKQKIFKVYLNHLATELLYKLEAKEKKMFMFEWQKYSKKIILDTICIIYIDSTSDSKLL